jgi:hypothetical protein
MEHGDAAAMNVRRKAATGCHRSDLCSASIAMSKANAPACMAGMTGESRDALESLPYDRYELGVDTEGAVHHHSPRADRVIVVAADGSIEKTIDLSEQSLGTYVEFVADRRGWDGDPNYAETYGDILEAQL